MLLKLGLEHVNSVHHVTDVVLKLSLLQNLVDKISASTSIFLTFSENQYNLNPIYQAAEHK